MTTPATRRTPNVPCRMTERPERSATRPALERLPAAPEDHPQRDRAARAEDHHAPGGTHGQRVLQDHPTAGGIAANVAGPGTHDPRPRRITRNATEPRRLRMTAPARCRRG